MAECFLLTLRFKQLIKCTVYYVYILSMSCILVLM